MPVKEYTNRLINEKSPYLLQHAHNPVDWYPWGDEAFEKAKREDKPVFLSIGYSTCHWCHVMERESFGNEQVAAALHRDFVSIKVDREERPDVDHFYMSACTALSGAGGWPLSCFLTPDRKPFFAGTYFPREDRFGSPGFLTLLAAIAGMWRENRGRLTGSSDEVLRHIAAGTPAGREEIRPDILETAFHALEKSFDPEYGGFGPAPKFPCVQNLLFLMRYGTAYPGSGAAGMVARTLDAMRDGGIHDAVGGGFCRYSTDREWLVPHFEKMAYDNAMLLLALSEASAAIHPHFARVARETMDFCTRELLEPSGGFATAIDADSEGEEGRFYLFTPEQVTQALGAEEGARYCRLFRIAPGGNFDGASIPNRIGVSFTASDEAFAADSARRLRAVRDGRVPPFRDDKQLTGNNGLMIAAFAAAGRILEDDAAVTYARRCARFVLDRLTAADGRLLGRFRDGEAACPATSDDYAYLIWGLIELYESTFEPGWLERALSLTDDMDRLFRDETEGGYFLTGSDVHDLPVRMKNTLDGALPAGNSVAAANLLRLSRLTGDGEMARRAQEIVGMSASGLNTYPVGYGALLCTRLYGQAQGCEIVLVNGEGFEELRKCIPRFAPFTVTAAAGEGYEKMAELAPFLRDYRTVNGRAAAYVCRGGACLPPVSDPEELRGMLERAGEAGKL